MSAYDNKPSLVKTLNPPSSHNYENALDKQIAATALAYDLTVVTRNINDFSATGVSLVNPFTHE